MKATVPQSLKPRKKPVQVRSDVTVEAILTATIQVLLKSGLKQLTTTRVAERAGVSVGTLYQYFPNKDALLYAILLAHFEMLNDAFEELTTSTSKLPLAQLANDIADTYVGVKLSNLEATRALYLVANVIHQAKLPTEVYARLKNAIVNILERVSDASFRDPQRTAFTLLAALAGLSRSSFGASFENTEHLEVFGCEARILVSSYLLASSDAIK